MNANPICMDLEHDLSCPLDQYHLQEWRYLEENRTLQDCFLFSNFTEGNYCLGKKLHRQQDFQCSLIIASYFREVFPIENLNVFSQSLEGSPLVAVGANLNIHKLIKNPHILFIYSQGFFLVIKVNSHVTLLADFPKKKMSNANLVSFLYQSVL